MAKLVWNTDGKRLYETGVQEVALYVHDGTKYGDGVAWEGVTAINESPSGADASDLYANNSKYLTMRSVEKLDASISAYMYPDEFMACDGMKEAMTGVTVYGQTRAKFGLVYKTKIGNDEKMDDFGYKLHILYNATAAVSERPYQTINENPEAMTFSWSLSTTPVNVPNYKPTSLITINSTKVDAKKLADLEAKLYGTNDQQPTLLTPEEVFTALNTTQASA